MLPKPFPAGNFFLLTRVLIQYASALSLRFLELSKRQRPTPWWVLHPTMQPAASGATSVKNYTPVTWTAMFSHLRLRCLTAEELALVKGTYMANEHRKEERQRDRTRRQLSKATAIAAAQTSENETLQPDEHTRRIATGSGSDAITEQSAVHAKSVAAGCNIGVTTRGVPGRVAHDARGANARRCQLSATTRPGCHAHVACDVSAYRSQLPATARRGRRARGQHDLETRNLQTVGQLSLSRPAALELPLRVSRSHPVSRRIRSFHQLTCGQELVPRFRSQPDPCVQLHLASADQSRP